MPGKEVRLVGVSDETIEEVIGRAGSWQEAADELGIPRTTLIEVVKRRRLKAKPKHKLRHIDPKVIDPAEDVTDVEVYEQRIKDLERHANRQRSESVQVEKTLRRLEAVVKEVRPRLSATPKPRSGRVVAGGHEFGLLLSDTHAGEVVNLDETLGMNEYHWDVMVRRMERLRDAVLSYQAHRPYPIEVLNLFMLGDMLSGDIHDELVETNEFNAAEACVRFSVDCAEFIRGLVPHFKRINVIGVPGNHPRAKKKPQAKNAHNNGDWLAYHMMRLAMDDCPSVHWQIPNGSFESVLVAKNWRVLAMHGDGIRSSMPGVPWGGVVRRVTTLQQQFEQGRRPIDYVVMGHFHNIAAIEGVGTKTIINGSVKGVDEYSLKAFGSGRSPAQVLLTFHPDRGLTDVSVIDLEETLPALLRTPLM
jgi:hypothetical protein